MNYLSVNRTDLKNRENTSDNETEIDVQLQIYRCGINVLSDSNRKMTVRVWLRSLYDLCFNERGSSEVSRAPAK